MDKQPTDSQYVSVSSGESFNSHLDRPFIDAALHASLVKANVLIIPSEGYGELTNAVHFPDGTSELYQYLSAKGGDGLRIELAVQDNEFKELALHADVLTLATLLVKDFVAPLTIGLLANYIYDRLGRRAPDARVKSKVIVTPDDAGPGIIYTYDGPATEYERVMTRTITKLRAPSSKSTPRKRPSQRRHRRSKG
jgi:hypothetical protein